MAKAGILQRRAVKRRGRCLSGQMERKGRQQEKPTIPAKPYVQLPSLLPFGTKAITARSVELRKPSQGWDFTLCSLRAE